MSAVSSGRDEKSLWWFLCKLSKCGEERGYKGFRSSRRGSSPVRVNERGGRVAVKGLEQKKAMRAEDFRLAKTSDRRAKITCLWMS
ncbi:hypothetical protein J6590_066914 [Homalodisca vitripennis]|nr:hypothetical protein J6590_066914 [Homalodisca vitripennis]